MIPQKTQAQRLYERSEEQLDVIEEGELLNWKQHPITIALLLNLKGDSEALKERWGAGEFTKESADATMQENSCMIGMNQATEKIIDWIELLTVENENA